jgi:hypothetical protein
MIDTHVAPSSRRVEMIVCVVSPLLRTSTPFGLLPVGGHTVELDRLADREAQHEDANAPIEARKRRVRVA